MNIKPIKTELDYNEALERLEVILMLRKIHLKGMNYKY